MNQFLKNISLFLKRGEKLYSSFTPSKFTSDQI